jgi:hypothetical protein
VLSLIEDHVSSVYAPLVFGSNLVQYKNILRDTGLEEVVAACVGHEDNVSASSGFSGV